MKKKYYIIIIIIISIIALFLIYKGSALMDNSLIKDKLKKLNYKDESIELIIKNNIDNYILTNKLYSNTIEVALLENKFDYNNLELYSYFEYKDNENFIDNLNKLTKLGYTRHEIEVFFDKLKIEDITIVANRENKESELLKYCLLDNFDVNNYDRYLDYKSKNSSYDYNTVIKYVNINLDYAFYDNTKEALNKHTELVLINKYYKVDENYIPKDLKSVNASCASNNNIYVVAIVKDAFENLCMDAKSIGLTIKAISAYRSFEVQRGIYNGYLKNDPVEIVDTYSARAGHSEHQSGYVLDVYNVTLPYTSFGLTNEYAWLKNNAHRYGFIIRYQKSFEHITGYKSEPWHIRYVGIEASTYIYNNNITLEEYIDSYEKGTIKK